MKHPLSLFLICDSTALIERALELLAPSYVLEKTLVKDWATLEKKGIENRSFIFWTAQEELPLEEVLKRSKGRPIFVIMDELEVEASSRALQAGVQEVIEANRWALLPILLERCMKRQLQKASAEESALLVKHADQAPGVIYQFQVFSDGKVHFPFVSDRMEDISAIPVDQLRRNGNLFFDYLHKDDYDAFVAMGRQSTKTLCNWSMDFRLKSKEGDYRWMHASSKPVHLPDHSCLWYGYMEDITNDKQNAADFKDSEEQVKTLFENAPDGIAILDKDAIVVRWNPKAVEIFGWDREEMIGQCFYEAITPNRNHELYRDNLLRFHKGEEGVFLNKAVEIRACHKDGREFPIMISISGMQSKGELFFLCFIGDNTKRKQAQRKIQQSLKEKEVLLKEIHHRVKNNLQVITSLLSLQSSFITDPFISDIFKKSQYRINSMGMVHEMLYQSKDLSKIDYKEYLERLTTSLKRAMIQTEQNIEIVLNLPAICLNVDTAIPLSLIVNELLTNAFKYAFIGKEQGVVKLSLEALEEEKYMLMLEDDGRGYSLGLMNDQTPSLGLLLVRKLAVQLCGRIERLSIPQGTAYRLFFQEILAN